MASVKQIILLLVGCTVLIAGLVWWNSFSNPGAQNELLLGEEGGVAESIAPLTEVENDVINPEITNTMNPKAVFTTNQGTFELELFADQMPITTGNFISLIEDGFYDGTKFHRVIDGFMIQGGDPNSKGDDVMTYGTGGPGYAIEDEHVAGENLSNTRGTISMANSGPNSGGSQFFINVADNVYLDFDKEPLQSKHPVFGQIVSGMDIIDAISKTQTGPRDVPLEPIIVESVTLASS